MKNKILPGLKKSHYHLLAYSAAATAYILFSEEADAQINYTDISPDITVDEPGVGVQLDFDNNDTIDLVIAVTSAYSFSFTYFGSVNYFKIDAVVAIPYNSVSLAGITSSGFALPYAITNDIVIGPGVEFHSNAFQSLAYNFFAVYYGFSYIDLVRTGFWVNGVTDRFLGFRFTKEGQTHYGWVRLDVEDGGTAFTIKDLAYGGADSTITTQIIPTAITEHDASGISIYSFGSDIHVNLKDQNYQSGTIKLFDVTGREISEQAVTGNSNIMHADGNPQGIYIVQVFLDDKETSKKIFLGK